MAYRRRSVADWPLWLKVYLVMAAILLAVGLAIHLASPGVDGGRFVILQLNDVYRIEGIEQGTIGSLARVRTVRRRFEEDGVPVLMLHAGDLLYPSVMSKYLNAKPMIEVLNRLDGDPGGVDHDLIATFGNHEFEEPRILVDRLREADFDWVSSNVRYASRYGVPEPLSKRFPNVHDVIVRDVGGVRVGIFGITCDEEEAEGVFYNYDDEGARDEIVRAALARLEEQGAQVIIALTHQSLKEDRRIAKAFPEIHLIVGGHEHTFLRQRVGSTLITKADADARSLVRIEVQGAPDGTVSARPEKIDIGPGIQPDEGIEKLTDVWFGRLEKAVKKDLKARVATAGRTLEGVETAIRTRETALGNFLSDIMRERTGASIAFLNGGSIRLNDNIPAGKDLTTYDMEGIFYYDSDIVTLKLTGADLLGLLQRSVSEVDLAHGRFLQVSGIRFIYHVQGSKDEPSYRVQPEEVWVLPPELPAQTSPPDAYLPLDLEETYTVATIEYLRTSGYKDGYELFGDKRRPALDPKEQEPLSLKKITQEAIAGLPDRTITTDVGQRIVRKGG